MTTTKSTDLRSLAMIRRLVEMPTVSRDSNLALIEYYVCNRLIGERGARQRRAVTVELARRSPISGLLAKFVLQGRST
jgi:hypothetical protein